MTDQYAKGMVESGDEHFDLTPELDRSQYRRIRPHLGRRVLEVGAGSGRIARMLLADEGLTLDRYIASEPSDHFFSQLKRRVEGGELIQGTTGDLVKVFPAAFDTIFSVDVMEHVEHDRQFVEDCLRMLAPGGKLVILVPALQFLYSDLDRNIGHYRRYDKKMMRALFNGLPCRIIGMRYTSLIGAVASLIFFKLGKVTYQKGEADKARFMVLERLYSRLVPAIDFAERIVPPPVGLNLTVVIEAGR